MATFAIRHVCANKSLNLRVLRPIVSSKVSNSQRSYTSALYVPGNKAHKTFAYLSPELDFDNRFTDVQKLQKELNLRGFKANAEELQKTWEYYQYIKSNRDTLEEKHAEISNRIRNINQNKNLTDDDKKEIEALILQSKLVKQDLKVVKEAAWDLEEVIIPQLLKLPNIIDQETPIETSIVIKSVGEKPSISENKKQNHLDIGKNLGMLEYRNPIQYYLCDEAVLFELGALALAGRILKESGSVRVAGPDFCRSIVVEGCGMDHENSMETFILQTTDDVEKNYLINRLHLVGGASLPALLAMYTKQVGKLGHFPIKIFSSGRQYTPFPNTSAAYGLFSVCQASAVQALTLVEKQDSNEYKSEFQNLIETASKIYDEIGCHYQIVMRSVKELNPAETMRVSFEMWSPYASQYIEVGHVSACGNYISKRLLIAFQTSNRTGFSAALTGTLLSVPKVLGCLLEENPEKFILPEKIARFIN